MATHLHARARVVGDNVNSDYIIASTRKRDSLDVEILKQFLLEAVDPSFAQSVRAGDVLVAGENFGCGSAMEVAATVILAAGIRAVLARSFARAFFRNAVNNGLVPLECDTTGIAEGDRLAIDLVDGDAHVTNFTRNTAIVAASLPAIALRILDAGGLVAFLRAQPGHSFTASTTGENPRRTPA